MPRLPVLLLALALPALALARGGSSRSIALDPVIGDLDGSCVVDTTDLLILLGAWGTPGGDLNNDGTTDADDQDMLIAMFGAPLATSTQRGGTSTRPRRDVGIHRSPLAALDTRRLRPDLSR